MTSKSLKRLLRDVGYTEDWKLFNLRIRDKIGGSNQIYSLWVAYKIARFSQFFSPDVFDFYFSNATYRELSIKYNTSEGVLKNNVFRQTRRYYDLLGADLYADMLAGKISEADAITYKSDLQSKFESMELRGTPIESYFYEDIFSGAKMHSDFALVTQEEYEEARDKLSRLSRPATEFLLGTLDDRLKDYIVYLLTTKDSMLVSVDRERKSNLLLFMKLDDKIN